MKNSSWDLDYRDGVAGESKVADLLHIDTVEVKTDRRWIETGNIYIETECYYVNDDAWKPSGINVSKATHWGFVLEDSVVIVPTYRLKESLPDIGKPITCNIQPNPSKGYLITPGGLLECIRRLHNIEIQEQHENFLRETYG